MLEPEKLSWTMRIVRGEGGWQAEGPKLILLFDWKMPLNQYRVVSGNMGWRWTDENKEGEFVQTLRAGYCLEL